MLFRSSPCARGHAGAFVFPTRDALFEGVSAAYRLSNSLPTLPYEEFVKSTAELGDTEMERMQKVRIGQARFREEGADLITFTSSSTAENFVALKLPMPAGIKTASIGPITSDTLRKLGLAVDVEAKKFDIPGVVAAIVKLLG